MIWVDYFSKHYTQKFISSFLLEILARNQNTTYIGKAPTVLYGREIF
jgi:hypothetical protein